MRVGQDMFAVARTWNITPWQEENWGLTHPRLGKTSRRMGSLGIVAVFAAIFFLFCGSAFAQTTQSITGLVIDTTGAVVPNATVTVHNDGTGVDKVVTTTSTGNYSVPFLAVGVYDVTAKAKGFETVTKTNITLSTAQTAGVNITLKAGAVTETVTVNGSSTVLDYEKADVGNVMENQLVEELPDTDNDTFNFTYLSPGMMTTQYDAADLNQSAQSFGIHGGSVELNIDGSTNMAETGFEHYTIAPPPQALQEIKITTSPVDASIGRSPGGQIDMTLKTGTKDLHGAAYEYLQRAFLNANTPQNDANIFKDKAAGDPASTIAKYNKGAYTQNQWGFELDGPVVAPRLWGRAKQTFFMLLFENMHGQGVGTLITSVPTTAEAGGDFSDLLNQTVNGAAWNGAIYDPTTEAACTAHNTDNGTYAKGNPAVCRYQYGYGPGTASGSQGNPVQTGTPNKITNPNPVATAILSWYPAPNQSPTPTTANPYNNNYVGNNPSVTDDKIYIVKLDQVVSPTDSFFITGKLWKNYQQANNAFPRSDVNAAHPGLNEAMEVAHYNGTDYRYPSLNVGETHIFNAHLVNSIRGLITTGGLSDSTGPASGYDPSNLGFSSNIGAANATYFKRFPLTNISNYNALGSQAVLWRAADQLQLTDTVNWTRGNHVMHFGGELRRNQYSVRSANGTGLSLSTNDAWTQQWDTNVSGGATGIHSNVGYTNNYSGNSIATMEAGTWVSASASTAAANYLSTHYNALYFQDDWKVRPNLTLNLGVRWEDPGRGIKDRYNRQWADWDFTDPNPVTSLVSTAGLPVLNGFVGGPTYAGVAGKPAWEFKRVWYEFGPRAGFAYTLNEKTVIRGSMGLFFNDAISGNQNEPAQTGYATNTGYTSANPASQLSASGANTTIQVPLGNLANPFPTFQATTGNCGGNWQQCLMTNLGQGSTYFNPKYHPSPFLNTSFGIERQFTAKDTLQINYAGARMYGQAYTDNLNHISASAQAACDPLRGGPETNCTGSVGLLTNPFYNVAPFSGSSYYTSTTIAKTNFTRPYPQFGDISQALINGGKYWYNGLEAIYTHRTSYGLTANIGYTHSKAISANGYVDTINRVPARALAGTDVPHRLTALIVYKLPIARGSGFFPNMPRTLDFVIGGWETANTYIWQSGFPQAMASGWIVDQKANGGNLLPKKRYWPGNTNPWYPSLQAGGSDNYIQRLKPCVATVDATTGAYDWIAQSLPFVASGACTTPNYISINTSYQVQPNVEYTGAREGIHNQLDTNISKNFHVYENMAFQMRIDAFNVFNHLQTYGNGFDTSISDGLFGIVRLGSSGNGSQANRLIQISGRLSW